MALVALALGLRMVINSVISTMYGIILAIIGRAFMTFFRGSHIAVNWPDAELIATVLPLPRQWKTPYVPLLSPHMSSYLKVKIFTIWKVMERCF